MNPLLDFSTALQLCKMGDKISRRGWNGKGMYVVLQTGYPNGVPCSKNTSDATGIPEGALVKVLPYLVMKTVDDALVPWLASQTDILAEDWEVVN